MTSFRSMIFQLQCLLIVIGCSGTAGKDQVIPSKETILKHLDTTIRVYEKYAVVKLPLEGKVDIWNPGLLEIGPENRIFAANLTGEIYSLMDSDGDGLEDRAVLFCDVKNDGLRTPTGMIFKDWDLYVGLPQQIRVYRDLDRDFVADTSFVFFDRIPFSDHPYEYSTGMKFDREGWLHVALATDSWNAGASPDSLKYRGSILKISPSGEQVEVAATGIRSVFGMDLNQQGAIFFSDNQGGQNLFEELHVLKEGSFYGHNPDKYEHTSVQEPIAHLDYEVAPAEMQFYTEEDEEVLIVAYYGPGEYWERGAITKIVLDTVSPDSVVKVESPIAELPKTAGLVVSQSGNIYASSVGVTDYWYFATDRSDGSIYRLIRQDWVEPSLPIIEERSAFRASASELEQGAFLFASRACSSCHSIDGSANMLGPDLKNIADVYNREELIEEISFPSKRLKPGDFPTRITTVDDEVFLGRVITRNENEVQLMLIGNLLKTISAKDIKSSEQLSESLMYPGLLEGLEDKEINALINYLLSL